jgi:hypothetical protein
MCKLAVEYAITISPSPELACVGVFLRQTCAPCDSVRNLFEPAPRSGARAGARAGDFAFVEFFAGFAYFNQSV